MKAIYALMLVALLTVVGCWGSSDFPFAGTWSGTWTNNLTQEGGGQNGSATITINSNGDFVGTMNNFSTKQTGALEGHMNGSGGVTGTLTYQGQEPQTITGDLDLTSNNTTLTGNLTIGGVVHTFTLTND